MTADILTGMKSDGAIPKPNPQLKGVVRALVTRKALIEHVCQRLKANPLNGDDYDQFRAIEAIYFALEGAGQGFRRRRNQFRADRLVEFSWLWPLAILPNASTALNNPTRATVGRLVQFFESITLLEHLEAGRHVRLLLGGYERTRFPYPPPLVAFARALGRARTLVTAGNGTTVKNISGFEAQAAWAICKLALTAAQCLAHAFRTHRIANRCPQCGSFFLPGKATYCTENCQRTSATSRRRKRDATP